VKTETPSVLKAQRPKHGSQVAVNAGQSLSKPFDGTNP